MFRVLEIMMRVAFRPLRGGISGWCWLLIGQDKPHLGVCRKMVFALREPQRTRQLLSTLAARRRNPATVIYTPVAASEPGVLGFTFDIVMLA
jgi:hypothetical protein